MRFTKIKGEDRPHSILKLPLLGKIRLGIKKVSQKTGKEYPTETDYFVCPPEVQAKFGETPKILPVMLPLENEEMFFRQFYAVYGSNQKIKCIGDGESAERRSDDGKKFDVICPHPENCEYGIQNKCRARTIIQVVLPDVNMGGVYQISTGSISSDIDIRSGIEMSRHLFGRISYVPMILAREEKKIPDPTSGKMQSHWPVKLYPQATVEQVNQIRQDNLRIIKHQERIALPEPVIEGPQDDTPIQMIDIDEITTNTEKLESEIVQPKTQPEPVPPIKRLINSINSANTLDELKEIWTAISNELKKKTAIKLTVEESQLLTITKNKRKKEIEAQPKKQVDIGEVLTAIANAETIDGLMDIWAEVEPFLQGEDRVKVMMARDRKASEDLRPKEQTTMEVF